MRMSFAFVIIVTLATPATAVAADENLKQAVEKLASGNADNTGKQNPWLIHDTIHPVNDNWLKELEISGAPCCDGNDAIRLDDPQWRFQNNHYQVFLDNDWIIIRDFNVLDTRLNRDGLARVWPVKNGEGRSVDVRCFLPGIMG